MPVTIFSMPQRIVYTHIAKNHPYRPYPNFMLGGRRWDIAVPDLRLLLVLKIGVENIVEEGQEDFEHDGEKWLVARFDGGRFTNLEAADLSPIEKIILDIIATLEFEEEDVEWEDNKIETDYKGLLLPAIAEITPA